MPEDDPQYSMKKRFLGGWSSREFQPQAQWNRKAKDLLSFFRTISSNAEELSTRPNFNAPVSIRNEVATLTNLEKACEDSLKKFPDSLQTDHKLLKVNKWEDSNHRNCVIMRAGEKEVLMWYIKLCREGRRLLALPYEEHAKEAPAKGQRLRLYYEAVIEPLARGSSRHHF
uniref:Rubisco LSMT substrate-binding domain-containing protein n=1 Tax=Lotharella oceanica TaxID=641309 RepID=A0A7S2XEB0_9EUKA